MTGKNTDEFVMDDRKKTKSQHTAQRRQTKNATLCLCWALEAYRISPHLNLELSLSSSPRSATARGDPMINFVVSNFALLGGTGAGPENSLKPHCGFEALSRRDV